MPLICPNCKTYHRSEPWFSEIERDLHPYFGYRSSNRRHCSLHQWHSRSRASPDSYVHPPLHRRYRSSDKNEFVEVGARALARTPSFCLANRLRRPKAVRGMSRMRDDLGISRIISRGIVRATSRMLHGPAISRIIRLRTSRAIVRAMSRMRRDLGISRIIRP